MIFRKDEQDYDGGVYQHCVLERIEEALERLPSSRNYEDKQLMSKPIAEKLIVGIYQLIEDLDNQYN